MKTVFSYLGVTPYSGWAGHAPVSLVRIPILRIPFPRTTSSHKSGFFNMLWSPIDFSYFYMNFIDYECLYTLILGKFNGF
jgi:hypothetical protein